MQRKSWTSLEDEVLVKRVKLYGIKNWTQVAIGIPGRTSKSASERWRHFLDPAIKPPSQQAFTDYEAAVIVRAHALYGNKWQAIAALLPGRSCRAVKNYWHTNMGANAVMRGAVMVSNRFLAAGHSLESLLSYAPAGAAVTATPSVSEGATVFGLPAASTQASKQPSSLFQPAACDAAQQLPLQYTQQPALQLDAQCQQLMQLLAAGQPVDLSFCNLQQQVVSPAPTITAPAAPAAAAHEEEQCSASNSPVAPSTGYTKFSNASLCDQLLLGFSTAPAPQPSHSSSSADSMTQYSQQQPSCSPSWPPQAPIVSPVEALAGLAEPCQLSMEQLMDQLDASDFDDILADFDCELPMDMAVDMQLQQQQPRQQVAPAECYRCQAQAGEQLSCESAPDAPAGYADAAAAAVSSPSCSFGTSPAEAPPRAATPGPLATAGSTASQMSQSCVDMSQVTALLAEQQELLRVQQLQLRQQQLQLDALRAQLAQPLRQ